MIIVGLNNPGEQYKYTRHNIGAYIIDVIFPHLEWEMNKFVAGHVSREVFDLHGQKQADIRFLKPDTFMNASGESVVKALAFYDVDISKLIVIHDDIDVPFGTVKVVMSGGSGGHNGVKSITQCLGSDKYIRLKIGIGREEFFTEGVKMSTKHIASGFVLGAFSADEQGKINDIAQIAKQHLTEIIRAHYINLKN
jgi:PTH1 family peptidyl-tRNA hydrolase